MQSSNLSQAQDLLQVKGGLFGKSFAEELIERKVHLRSSKAPSQDFSHQDEE